MADDMFDDQLTNRLLHERILVLGGEVTDPLANRLCAQLLLLSEADDERQVSLFINSPGGSVSAGMAIYDTMQFIPNPVATLAMGFAASMGQFILGAGEPGRRYALPHSRIVMHQVLGGIGGNATDIRIQAENLRYTKRLMQELIAQHTGQTVERIDEDGDRDRWFTAQEAREYGIIDRVVQSASEVRPRSPLRRVGL